MYHFTFKELFLKLSLSCMIGKHNNNVKFWNNYFFLSLFIILEIYAYKNKKNIVFIIQIIFIHIFNFISKNM